MPIVCLVFEEMPAFPVLRISFFQRATSRLGVPFETRNPKCGWLLGQCTIHAVGDFVAQVVVNLQHHHGSENMTAYMVHASLEVHLLQRLLHLHVILLLHHGGGVLHAAADIDRHPADFLGIMVAPLQQTTHTLEGCNRHVGGA